MLIQKGGIARDIDKNRLHEYTAKGYTPYTVEETPIEPVPNMDTSPKKQAKGIGSISNDGYTVSVGTGGGVSILKAEAQERAAVCARYLQWPVNLMCRWL